MDAFSDLSLIDDESNAKIRGIIDSRRKVAAEQQARAAAIFEIQQKPYCKWELQEKIFMLPFIQEDIKRGQSEMANLIRRAQAAIDSLNPHQ